MKYALCHSSRPWVSRNMFFWLHCTVRCKKTVTTISKVHKRDNFESHNALKLRVTNIQGLHSNFVGCDVFLTSNLPEILGLCEANLNAWYVCFSFFVSGYFLLIWKDPVTNMHCLAIHTKEGLPFGMNCLLTTADFYFFLTGFTSFIVLLLFPVWINVLFFFHSF